MLLLTLGISCGFLVLFSFGKDNIFADIFRT